MIDPEIFDRVEKVYLAHKREITSHGILSALTEELGEYSRAVRVEDKAAICQNKGVKESSKVEIVDLILVCMIGREKLLKWESLWRQWDRIPQ